MKPFKLLRDNKEKKDYWTFANELNCREVKDVHLETADYTIAGLESIFCIERKRSSGEFAGNLPAKQFDNELQRMEKFQHAFIICEFTLEDIFRFPYNSGIPGQLWGGLRVTPGFLLKRLIVIETTYKTKIIFAGFRGEEMAQIICRRMVELYGSQCT